MFFVQKLEWKHFWMTFSVLFSSTFSSKWLRGSSSQRTFDHQPLFGSCTTTSGTTGTAGAVAGVLAIPMLYGVYLHGNGGIRKLSTHFERENSSVSLKFWRFWACWWNFLMKYWDPTLQLCITHWKLLCGLPPLWFLLWNQSIPVTNGVGYVYYIRYTYGIYKHKSKHIYIYTKHIHIFT